VALFQKRHVFLLALLVLSACGERELILEGERLDIRGDDAVIEVPLGAQPIRLSSPVNNTAWTHRAGTATHRMQQPAFAPDPTLIWSADIGEGVDRRHRITADPVAANGRIFTIDSRSTVAATSADGARLWARDLTPPTDNAKDASGGGLALAGDRLFATTGFGELVALDTASGEELWRQGLDASVTGAPTVFDNVVYVATRDSRALAIEADSGRIRWQLAGAPSASGVLNGAGPAVNDKIVVFPFSSAQVVAALRKGGLRIWGGSVSGARPGRAYANFSDISGDPVIVGDVIYAGNPAGRTVALDSASGDRIWTVQSGATGPIWVEGGSLFFLTDQGELARRDADTGALIWSQQLPFELPVRRDKRRRDIYAHFGPVLAGGSLWVASNDGLLRAFDPVDGALRTSVDLPGGAASRPIVVSGVMYVVAQNGKLLAFR